MSRKNKRPFGVALEDARKGDVVRVVVPPASDAATPAGHDFAASDAADVDREDAVPHVVKHCPGEMTQEQWDALAQGMKDTKVQVLPLPAPVWEYRREILLDGAIHDEAKLGAAGWEFCAVLWPKRVPLKTEIEGMTKTDWRDGVMCLFKRKVIV